LVETNTDLIFNEGHILGKFIHSRLAARYWTKDHRGNNRQLSAARFGILLVYWDNGMGHAMVVEDMGRGRVAIFDPSTGFYNCLRSKIISLYHTDICINFPPGQGGNDPLVGMRKFAVVQITAARALSNN
jgi:hypothetical protein